MQYKLYYCNPHKHFDNYDTLEQARDVLVRSDYCMYITYNGVVVHSTARDNPSYLVGAEGHCK